MRRRRRRARPASIKTDIYSFGLILFEVFTGKRAHDAKTINELKQLMPRI